MFSMTGFGRAEVQLENMVFSMEGKTVNHRYLDISIRMPKRYLFLEEELRKMIKKNIKRGKVDFFVNVEKLGTSEGELMTDFDLAKSYYEALEKISESLNIRNDVNALQISRFPEVVTIKSKDEDEEVVKKGLIEALEMTLKQMQEMRIKEGEETKTDLLQKVQDVMNACERIKEHAPLQIEEYKKRLKERMDELLEDSYSLKEERLEGEVVFLSEKSNINEEIVRMNSHLGQFLDTLELSEPIGRKLDFLIQEMNREINTISSKSHSVEIAKEVIAVKSAIEKMREQIQNLE